MAETSDLLILVKIVADNLHPSHKHHLLKHVGYFGVGDREFGREGWPFFELVSIVGWERDCEGFCFSLRREGPCEKVGFRDGLGEES